jgi:hypothetical protein
MYLCIRKGISGPNIMKTFLRIISNAEVIVHFVDIAAIVDHHSLNFVFIIKLHCNLYLGKKKK